MAAHPWRPRIGCAGVGRIGEHRMRAVADTGAAQLVAIADPDPARCAAAAAATPNASIHGAFEELLELDLDGVMIATPSAMNADQAVAALARGFAVFCQRPLARTAPEAARPVAAAAAADRLLGVDISYRQIEAMRNIRALARRGELGNVCALDRASREPIGEPPDAWGGRAAATWVRRLARGDRFDPGAWHLVEVSRILDRIYGREESEAPRTQEDRFA